MKLFLSIRIWTIIEDDTGRILIFAEGSGKVTIAGFM